MNSGIRLRQFIQKHITASDAYIEAAAWAKFAGNHSILEINELIQQAKGVKPIVHPEIKEGEVFLINAKKGEDWSSSVPFFVKKTRRGTVAFKTNSFEVIEGYFPIFAVLKNT